MRVVMVMVLAFSVDIRSMRIVVLAVFRYALAMLGTLHFHFVLMHERNKPCHQIAQRQSDMAKFQLHLLKFLLPAIQYAAQAHSDVRFF